ncbi:TIGR04083 family peptide-modifying radical SAM enzyme [Methanobrevibacter sp. DSM 116169]|uniref:TIGR04083 family peptide-modifying radical SAM enzyme n=1 Tax=Methanobrevibacter sp. DSM 116169 TaxID=3242727 RepID=UPI0038FCA471
MSFHVMIIPTLNCQSNCKYCWGSENTDEIMDKEIIDNTIKWLKDYSNDPVHFTFHGGEPLLAGYDFYSYALDKLKNNTNFNGFSLQSNIWLLNEKLIDLFKTYDVSISTSIDGPKEINDSQRGEGYFDKTMHNYNLANENGVNINFVSTITSKSIDKSDEIYDFFKNNNMNLKIHGALPSLRGDNADPWALDASDYGELLVEWLDKYLYDLDKFSIVDLDHICKSTLRRRGTLCTFADCIGTTLAIGHDGSIYPCYRFVGMDEYVLGNVKNNPSKEDIENSSAWAKLQEFRTYVSENCNSCKFHKYCEGGCPYNAIVAYKTPKAVDPQCESYKKIFEEVSKRANKEFLKSAVPGMNTKKDDDKFSIMDLMMKP